MKMTNEEMMMSSLNKRDLCSITFIHDYVQLNFDGPIISIYAPSNVLIDGKKTYSNEFGYSDSLLKIIGSKITSINEINNSSLTLTFDDSMRVEISLKFEDRSSAEAAMFQGGPDTGWVVW